MCMWVFPMPLVQYLILAHPNLEATKNKHWLAAAAKSLQSCPTLCNPTDGSPPGSPVPGILQVRTLEWVSISLSNAWKWKVKVKSLSNVRPSATPWTAAYQAPPSMGFSRQEYWSGVPLPSLKHWLRWVQKLDRRPGAQVMLTDKIHLEYMATPSRLGKGNPLVG